MPRSRKSPGFQHAKHQHVDADDGWTHVVKGPTMQKANANSKAAEAKWRAEIMKPKPLETLDQYLESYNKCKEIFRNHPVIITFLRQLNEQLTSHPNVEVSHALCLGLGSPSANITRDQSSMKQLILFEFVLEVLKSRHRIAEPVHVYFQEPRFSELDILFLTSLHHEVIPWPRSGRYDTMFDYTPLKTTGVQDPCGNQIQWQEQGRSSGCCAEYINDTTFLYTPHLEFLTIYNAFTVAMPTLFLGNDLTEELSFGYSRFDEKTREFVPAEEDELKAAFTGGKWQDLSKLKKARKDLIEQLDWVTPAAVKGADLMWYNGIVLALKKVPDNWTINAEIRDAHRLLLVAERKIIEDNNAKVWKEDWDAYVQKHENRKAPVDEPYTFNCSEELLKMYKWECFEAFERDPSYVQLWERVDEVCQEHPELRISEVVCLGLGSLAVREEESQRTSRDAIRQLHFVDQAIEVLKGQGKMPTDAPTYFQSPNFNEIDIKVLRDLKHEVVPFPVAGKVGLFELEKESSDNEKIQDTGEPSTVDDAAAKEAVQATQGKSEQLETINNGQLQCRRYLSRGTFLYCPQIPSAVLEEAISHVKPTLYLGPKPVPADDKQREDITAVQQWAAEAKWYDLDFGGVYCKGFALALTKRNHDE